MKSSLITRYAIEIKGGPPSANDDISCLGFDERLGAIAHPESSPPESSVPTAIYHPKSSPTNV